MASPFEPHSSQTAKEAIGSEWTGRCAKLRAQTQATSSRWRLRRRERNWNPGCRQICGRLSWPPRKRGRCGRTSRPSRAEIGSSGSPPPSPDVTPAARARSPAVGGTPQQVPGRAPRQRLLLAELPALPRPQPRLDRPHRLCFIVRAEGLDPEIVDCEYVVSNFFPLLGVAPAVGRLIGPADDATAAAAPAVAIVSWSYWKSRFNQVCP